MQKSVPQNRTVSSYLCIRIKKQKNMEATIPYLLERLTKWAIQIIWTLICGIAGLFIQIIRDIIRKLFMWTRISISVIVELIAMLISYLHNCIIRKPFQVNLNNVSSTNLFSCILLTIMWLKEL